MIAHSSEQLNNSIAYTMTAFPQNSSAASPSSSRDRARPSSPFGHKLAPGSEPFLYCLTIFLPPLPVYICRGVGPDLYLNILLFIFGFFPAVVHACWIIHIDGKRDKTRTFTYTEAERKTSYSPAATASSHPSSRRSTDRLAQAQEQAQVQQISAPNNENPFEPTVLSPSRQASVARTRDLVESPESMSVVHDDAASQASCPRTEAGPANVSDDKAAVQGVENDRDASVTPAPPYSITHSPSQRKKPFASV